MFRRLFSRKRECPECGFQGSPRDFKRVRTTSGGTTGASGSTGSSGTAGTAGSPGSAGTAAPKGNEFTLTAALVCFPLSPKTVDKISEAGFITLG